VSCVIIVTHLRGACEKTALSVPLFKKTWQRVVWCNGSGAVEQARKSWVATILGTDVAGRQGQSVRGVDEDTKMAHWARSAGVVVGFQACQVVARRSLNEARAFLVLPRSFPQIP
jgi:hypothetical protein